MNGISAQSDSSAVSAIRTCVAVALVSLAILVPKVARAQECEPGDRQVRSLRFVGNTAFSDDDLSARVITTPSSFAKRHFRFFGTPRCYPPNGLAPDAANITTFYKYNGFYDTRVDTVVTPVAKDVVNVTFRINEGQPLVSLARRSAAAAALRRLAEMLADTGAEDGQARPHKRGRLGGLLGRN